METYITLETLAEKTQKWLNKIKPVNQHKIQFNKEKSALLVVDMQKFFLDPSSPTFTSGGPVILPNVKKLIAAFEALENKHVSVPSRKHGNIPL